MARPHIEFIQSQVLPFLPDVYEQRPSVDVRTLSRDPEDGAASTILRYSPGWQLATPQALTCHEELFVLSGALEINGRTYSKHCYAHLPAGYSRNTMSSPQGAVVLTFFSAEPEAGPSAAYHPDRLVEFLDTRAMEGQTGKRKHMKSGDWDPSGTVHKTLYVDPETGERTWLIGLMPYWFSPMIEKHPVAEEEFAVLGDICFPNGIMRDGGYFWRPPDIEHGPFGTWGGTLHLCRCKGGAFSADVRDGGEPNWAPTYDPIIPDELRAHVEAAKNYDLEPNH